MPQAVIHIGTEKTGTSHLQQFLESNREELARHGIGYPAFLGQTNHTRMVVGFIGGHQDIHRQFGLVDAKTTAAFRERLAADLGAQLAREPSERWIFSSEHFSSRFKTAQPVVAFRDWMSRWFNDFEIIVYLRRQDFMAPSAYSTFIRSGGIREWAMPDLTGPYFDLAALLDRWTAAFGPDRVTARPYLEAEQRQVDLLDDFLATLGLPCADRWQVPPGQANERLSGTAVELLLLINKAVKEGPARPFVARAQLTERLAEIAAGPPSQFPRQVMEDVAAHFRQSNEEIIRKIGANDPAWYAWLEQAIAGPATPEASISAQDATSLLVQLGQERLLLAADDPQLRSLGAKVDKVKERATRRLRRRNAPDSQT